MNSESLKTSFWLMVAIQTIGSVDLPGRGDRKMPAPRQYIAIFITWIVLFFASGINAGMERGAAMMGWLLVLVGTVVGPFGNAVISFFNTIATQFAPPGGTGKTASTASGPGGAVTGGTVTA